MTSGGVHYDFIQIKKHETLKNIEVLLRIGAALSIFAIGLCWPEISDPIMAAWTLSYVSSVLLLSVVAARLPDKGGAGLWFLMTVLYVAEVSLFISLGLWLWTLQVKIFNVFSMALWAGLMLHVVSFPEMGRHRRSILVVFVSLQAIGFVVLWIIQGKEPLTYLTAAGGFAILLGYFVFATFRLAKAQMQAQKLTQKLVAAERTAAVGNLTGGVAHDFNNLLTVVMGNLELTREVDDQLEKQMLIEEAYNAAARGAQLTSDLLSFSRKSVLRPQLVDVNTAVLSSADFVRRVIPSRIAVRYSLQDAPMPPSLIDVTKFQTMLLNFVANARDALPSGGEIRIETESSPDGFWVALRVRDTGTGIPAEILDRVTEPFFSTKPVGQGTGLGLSMAHGFAEQSGGQLLVESGPDKGTVVTVWLPAAAPVSQAAKQTAAE